MKRTICILLTVLLLVGLLPVTSLAADVTLSDFTISVGDYCIQEYFFTGENLTDIAFAPVDTAVDVPVAYRISSMSTKTGSVSVSYFGLFAGNCRMKAYNKTTGSVYSYYTVTVKAPTLQLEGCPNQPLPVTLFAFSSAGLVCKLENQAGSETYISKMPEAVSGWKDPANPNDESKTIWKYKFTDTISLNAVGAYTGTICLPSGGKTARVVAEFKITVHDHKLEKEEGVAPTCIQSGWTGSTYCALCGQTIVGRQVLPATGHDLVDHAGQDSTCTEKGWNPYKTCRNCDYTTYTEIPAKGHDLVDHAGQDSTCDEKGWNPYQTCRNCDYTTFMEIPAKGHDWKEDHTTKANCTEPGVKHYTCTRCPETREEVVEEALGHSFNMKVVPMTCTQDGYTEYTCIRCPYSYRTDEKKAPGHSLVHHEGQKAGCETEGCEPYDTCANCDYTTFKAIPATGHDDEDVVTPPGCENGGFTTSTCKNCGRQIKHSYTPANGHDYGGDGICKNCGKEDPNKSSEEELAKKYKDMPAPTHWSYPGIIFCLRRGYMKGVSDDFFNPGGYVTRAQLVTILYRIAGSPDATYKGVFTDVPNNTWYSLPVEWAAENGVVLGYTPTLFRPHKNILREQIAAILYRYVSPVGTYGPLEGYVDYDETSTYAKEPLAWAVKTGLIDGIASKDGIYLAPKKTATRAQIATIIMRFIESKDAEGTLAVN